MKSPKLQLKLYVKEPNGFDLEKFVPVFHRWVKDEQIAGELLIDVADYAHVHDGPGILLVGHGIDYYAELGEGRPGLLFARKREAPAEGERLANTFKLALEGARLLQDEQKLDGLSFRTDEMLLRIADRLNAPNTKETFEDVKPELSAFLERLLGGTAFSLEQEGNEREMFTVRIRAEGAPAVNALLDRLG